MATIYQKTVSDKTLILAPREFILRPFDFQLWTEMRLGVFFGGVTSGGDNTQSSSETVTLSTSADRICFGLKNSSTNDIPGVTGSLFLGAMTGTGLSSQMPGGIDFGTTGTSNNLSGGGYDGTTLVGGTTAEYIEDMKFPSDTSAATSYNGFYAVKFVITNRGSSSQSISISSTAARTVSGTDYSAQALRLLINNATYGTPASVAWNTGAAARTIPDAIYIRMPFYSNRIRISAMRAIRYAP